MNRRPSSFRSFAAAATADSTTPAASMTSRPYFRGGRSQGKRGYSDGTSGPASGNQVEFVSGDSHLRAVQNANRGFRPGSQLHRPVFQQLPGLRPHRQPRQVRPAFGNYQQFRPQQMPQQVRASKPPDYREWEFAKPGPPPHCERFTVLSYNILADYLAIDHWRKLYPHIPHYILDWNWRKKNISFELGLWSADILCFQEVDRFQDIEAELKPRGYNGIWKMRTGDPVDGCAIFWRVSRFKLLHEESIQYNKLGLRDNVAQICVFESLKGQNNSNGKSTQSTSSASSNRVIICNIHVLFNPKRGDVKLGQIRVLLQRAHAVSKLWDDAPVVICGDFNCTPKSPMYNFIMEQKLDLSELARQQISGQASAEIHPSKPAYPGNYSSNGTSEATRTNDSDTSQLEGPSEKLFVNSLDVASSTVSLSVSATNDNHAKLSYKSASHESTIVFQDEVVEGATDELNELVDGATDELQEDRDSFLSELHGTDLSLSPDDLNSTSPNQKLHSHGDEILNETFYVENGIISDVGNSSSRPSAWTPAEIQTATGSPDCKVMEHPLKLTSAYAEVENSSGLRDSSGEPLITSYHRCFSGTVDYIWHSEGLQTAKVLAPIPKHVMEQTRGFPTRKWGSDHIALVSEFAFTKDTSSDNSSQ